jgi:hypothetical protein
MQNEFLNILSNIKEYPELFLAEIYYFQKTKIL